MHPFAFRKSSRAARSLTALLVWAVAASCDDAGDALRRRFAPASPRDRYAEMLRTSGLTNAALGRDWLAAGERAIRAPIAVALPYREVGYFAPDEAAAVAFRVVPRRGQRLTVRVERAGAATGALFVDLFRVAADSSAAAPIPVGSVDAATTPTVDTDVRGDRYAYVVRLQPELLRGERYVVTIAAGPSLAFPVAGRDARAAQSFFGAGRDDGRRRHEGVDIFAPRGTPVVAAAPGLVSAVGSTRLGGNVVWLWLPERGASLYYAHLDRQLVRAPQQVRAGDTLGLVGNTGNAATTVPHLHFGVYRRGEGAVDPFPFIDDRVARPAPVVADTAALGGWRRLAGTGDAALPADAPLRVDAATGDRYRVRLPNGAAAFVLARRTGAGRPLEVAVAGGGGGGGTRPLLERPAANAVVVDSVAQGETAPGRDGGGASVVGRWGDYVLVRTARGRTGWLLAAAGRRGAT
ncbi:MAG TPA: M23 family metallopeptidase [Gemmatimonadaceae bacterium]|nr:M23 family metallopeptidase [Gemmatimonadaceae bacterium]